MSTITKAEELVLGLPSKDRGELISKLIDSLHPPFDADDEDWVEEAMRRSKEMDENPESVMTHDEFFTSLRDYIK